MYRIALLALVCVLAACSDPSGPTPRAPAVAGEYTLLSIAPGVVFNVPTVVVSSSLKLEDDGTYRMTYKQRVHSLDPGHTYDDWGSYSEQVAGASIRFESAPYAGRALDARLSGDSLVYLTAGVQYVWRRNR